jgi:tRNA-splicing ligase RtcB (3'-phosphate/5'-hydroxy nucleic acid ligase)
MQDKRLLRRDSTQLGLHCQDVNIPVRIFANARVAIESAAVDELHSVLETPGIQQVAVTPDFHKGAGIPIGTVLKTCGIVLPQAIGNDINCGMRLHTTGLDASAVSARLDAWETVARHLFFEGGRQIPMSSDDRRALLQGGLPALFAGKPWDRHRGQWELVARHGGHQQLHHVDQHGGLAANNTKPFEDWIAAAGAVSYDDQIGSIGGGNHFVELQRVETILNRKIAYDWGLKKGTVAVMVHSGSVSIGNTAGRSIREILRASHPISTPHPRNGIYPISPETPHFWDLLHNAANFAFANRLFLAASAVESLERVLGAFDAPLLYDSPHNMVWRTSDGGFVHRKGATPARGPKAGGWGEPVLVPGSMGASSFVLAGMGNAESLESASHGAGRALSRGGASRSGHGDFEDFLKRFRVVTPLDLRRGRADILRKKLDELRAEGPHAYKGIRAVVDTLAEAGIARPVAELVPLATVKG